MTQNDSKYILSPINPALLRAVDAVAGVAQAGQDIAVIVEFAVDRGGIDGHVRMGRGKHHDAFRGGQQADEFDVECTGVLDLADRGDG